MVSVVIRPSRLAFRLSPLSAVLENPRALPNRDSGTGPAQARRAIGCHCKIKILDAGELLKDVLDFQFPCRDT